MSFGIRCLQMALPCLGELKGPIANEVCNLLNDAAGAVSDPSQEIKQKLNAGLGASPAMSTLPQNVTASSPACDVDVVAQAKAASDALQEAKAFENIISETTELVNNITAEVTEMAFSCAPFTALLEQLFDYNTLVDQCQQASTASLDFLLAFEANFDLFLNFMNLTFDVAFEATNLLQVFAGIGICNGPLNLESVVEVPTVPPSTMAL